MDTTQSLARQVIGELIGLARATDGSEHLINPGATAVILQGLAKTLPGAAGAEQLQSILHQIEDRKREMVPNCFQCACPCGKTFPYDLNALAQLPEWERQSKEALLLQAQRTAAGIQHADAAVAPVFYRALIALGLEDIRRQVTEELTRELKTILDPEMR